MRWILGAVICGLIVATCYIATIIAAQQTGLQKFTRYNDSWTVNQASVEYLRLERSLAAYALDMTDANRADARLRLEIAIGRIQLLQQGSLRVLIEGDRHNRAVFEAFRATLLSLDERLEHLDREGVQAALQSMGRLDSPLMGLGVAATEYGATLLNDAQAQMRHLYFIHIGLASGLILCGVVLVIFLLRQNRLLGRAHTRTERLATDLRQATEELQNQNLRLEHDAHHDALTGLPNRVLLRQDLELRRATAHTEVSSILLLDLDGFKDVNDTLGHDMGDVLLQAVAARLNCLSHGGDTACRLGGDEFAVLSTGLTREKAFDLANSIITKIAEPYQIDQLRIKINTCIGIAFSDDVSTTEELLKQADLALYEAKALGAGHACLFDPQMQVRLQETKSFEIDLSRALEQGEMEVYYQPQVIMATRDICGYEALLRWKHPTRGFVSPTLFIPVAERIGLIHELGAWVLKTACVEAAAWGRLSKISVNLSPVQFRGVNLIQKLAATLDQTGLSPDRLELEITESVMLDKNEQTLETLRQIKALGIHIAMDDFGTGYSSLGSLSSFPFEKMKIDRSFVRDVTTSQSALTIVELAIGVGRSLSMTTIVEGIETEEQFELLRRLGCEQAQGYLTGRPMPASELAYLHSDHVEGQRLVGKAL
ncbi:EAL domain-containing protein [Rhizobium sp. VS19-DR104.2]|uniref:putative bifunctional diguanylate cyclase/phosphodiesterase n=1 Tax=unclassified Rhizobium TaxID=2613769 RepID=UPI001CC52D02|nr:MULTISPECIES: EAL domain-containing protein [unclassified Rhizobium]MBZ5762001.1 EAL domain-containing protein [Rhizobium sp. VS19-DR96]MBZ5768353.1 EAL domain-containing protein [Rhizobium sp. VS19-DR129.2]MBZ5775623.1 EAL domain-containing protein [Rhizobium sp. VS19-DRK62.2]MBZ5786879.1 EAL domain-containing protein [Rhizobium sp. VS19-DR121]MBZ5804449.1 EAL domain-containing protein [Rhizobium sp. VS19-DR181]